MASDLMPPGNFGAGGGIHRCRRLEGFRSSGKVPPGVWEAVLRLKLSVFQRCKEIQKDVQIQDPNLSEFI